MSCKDCQWSAVVMEKDKTVENIFVGFLWKKTVCNIPGGEYNDGEELTNPEGACKRYKTRLDLGDVFK